VWNASLSLYAALKPVHLPRPNCTHSTSLLLVSWWSFLRNPVLLLRKTAADASAFKYQANFLGNGSRPNAICYDTRASDHAVIVWHTVRLALLWFFVFVFCLCLYLQLPVFWWTEITIIALYLHLILFRRLRCVQVYRFFVKANTSEKYRKIQYCYSWSEVT